MKPAYLKIGPVNIRGIPTNRLMIVLRTNGCEYARKTGGCSVCGFMKNAGENIGDTQIAGQFRYVLQTLDGHDIQEIDLLTLGSFLNDREVGPAARKALLGQAADLEKIRRITIESRAEYVSVEKLKECRQWSGDKILELGIGLESADDYIRNTIIRKNLSKDDFEQSVADVKSAGCDLMAYVLVKPPGLSEKEAIRDAVDTAIYVFDTARKYQVNARVAFEPVFICQNTDLETLFDNKEYRLANLWSVVEVVKRTHHLGSVFIGLSDESLSLDRMVYSCDKCYERVVNEIELFNKTQDFSDLALADCDCKAAYQYLVREEMI